MTLSEDAIREKLKEVIDPEVGLNIVDMGLVYGVKCENGNVHVEMTLTTPGCPMEEYMTNEVNRVLAENQEIKKVEVEIVWWPPWSPDMINREAGDL